MIAIRTYIEFLVKNKLTQSEFIFIMFVHNKSYLYDITQTYVDVLLGGEMLPRTLINDLISEGWITATVDNPTLLQHFTTTNKVREVFIDLDEDAKEFWNLYPAYVKQEQKLLPLSLIDKNEFYRMYGECTKYSKEEHNEIIEDLKYGIKEELINMRMDKFIKSEHYLKLRDLRLNRTLPVQAKIKSIERNEF